jgi:hypothetical protein
MSALTVPFLMPRVEEVVPDFAMLKDRLTGSSVVEERYTATMVPSSGDNYSVGGTGTKLMILRVANQNDYIDTSTMVLNMKVQGSGTDANLFAIDDHIFSLVDTINVKVGGQTVEVLNNVGHLVNALVQGSMPSSYYAHNGPFEGCYIYDKSVAGGVASGITGILDNSQLGAAASTYPIVNGSQIIQQRWGVGNSWFTSGRYYSIPLTLLGICRLPTLFAARNFQDLTIEILFRSNTAGALWNANPVVAPTGTDVAIGISDVTLTYDCCRMSADYYALMDNELKMPNGSGVAYPIDTYQVQPATIGGGSASPSLTRIVVAKGTRFLKSVYGVTKPQAAETSYLWRNNSSSGNFGFNSYQVIINSKRYPQLQIQSSALAFQELQKAYNQLGSTAAGGMIDWYNYIGIPDRRLGEVSNLAPFEDAVVAGTKDGTFLGIIPGDEAMFQLGVNLEQFLTNQPDAGGINTSTSGYQIAIELAQAAVSCPVNDTRLAGFTAASLTHFVFLHFTRILTLKAGAVEVLD